MAEWATITDADTYLTLKPNTSAWFATGLDQQAYLTTAYRKIVRDPDYLIPDAPTGDDLIRLQEAQIELAFFNLSNPNSDKAQNQIAQGIKGFKIGRFSQTYETSKGRDIEGYSKYPVCVADLIRPFLAPPGLSAILKRKQEPII